MSERWIKSAEDISIGSVLAGMVALFTAGPLASTFGSEAGPVGWLPLALVSVLAVVAPVAGKSIVLEGAVTLLRGVAAFGGLMLGLQLSLLSDVQRRAEDVERGSDAARAVDGLDRATHLCVVFIVMAFTAWLVAWVATRQLARLRQSAQQEARRAAREAEAGAHAEVLAALEALRREVDELRLQRAPSGRWFRSRRR